MKGLTHRYQVKLLVIRYQLVNFQAVLLKNPNLAFGVQLLINVVGLG